MKRPRESVVGSLVVDHAVRVVMVAPSAMPLRWMIFDRARYYSKKIERSCFDLERSVSRLIDTRTAAIVLATQDLGNVTRNSRHSSTLRYSSI